MSSVTDIGCHPRQVQARQALPPLIALGLPRTPTPRPQTRRVSTAHRMEPPASRFTLLCHDAEKLAAQQPSEAALLRLRAAASLGVAGDCPVLAQSLRRLLTPADTLVNQRLVEEIEAELSSDTRASSDEAGSGGHQSHSALPSNADLAAQPPLQPFAHALQPPQRRETIASSTFHHRRQSASGKQKRQSH